MRYITLLFLSALPVMAQTQSFSLGVKGGVPAQTPSGPTDRVPFVVGPTVTFRLFSRLSIESGVLFHRMGGDSTTGVYPYPENAVTYVYSTHRDRAIEVPVLAKVYGRAEGQSWRPFVTLGSSIRRTSFASSYTSSILSGSNLVSGSTQFGKRDQVKWNLDPSFGAGVDFKAGRFHLEPEARYSYWGAGKDTRARKNQVMFLLGFRL